MRRFTDLRAWQACHAFKLSVYRLSEQGGLLTDWGRRSQLEDAAKGPPAHVAEGFGRFSPPDFARFLVMARASLIEAQNHLIDAVDKRYITEATRADVNLLAEEALEEVTGLMEYLQSPEALRNARRARERRIASRPERRAEQRTLNSEPPNTEPDPPNTEPEPSNAEPGTELRT